MNRHGRATFATSFRDMSQGQTLPNRCDNRSRVGRRPPSQKRSILMQRTLVWRGLDSVRLEICRAEIVGTDIRADGTQIGTVPEPYELHYRLDGRRLAASVTGGAAIEIDGGDTDFFDLAFSPLFNSLPVLRYDLHRGGGALDFTMAFVSVPDLSVTSSPQRYEPVRAGVVRYRAGTFVAEIEIDDDALVTHYPGLAELAR